MKKIDIHCHLLHCVDDGSAGIEESLELLRLEETDDVKCVILTPHLRHHMFETPDEEAVRRFRILDEEREKAGIDITLGLSREYHFDSSLVEALNNRSVILMNNKVMLTEFSHDTTFSQMERAVSQLLDIGIRPLIAHIERYETVKENITIAEKLVENGAMLQVNAGSILGEEGSRQKKAVLRMIRQNLVFAVASDAHDLNYRIPNLGKCEKYLIKKFGEQYTQKVMHDNPMQLVPVRRG